MTSLSQLIKFQQRGDSYWIVTLRDDERHLGTVYRDRDEPTRWISVTNGYKTLGWADTREKATWALLHELHQATEDTLLSAQVHPIPVTLPERLQAARDHQLTVSMPMATEPNPVVLQKDFFGGTK